MAAAFQLVDRANMTQYARDGENLELAFWHQGKVIRVYGTYEPSSGRFLAPSGERVRRVVAYRKAKEQPKNADT